MCDNGSRCGNNAFLGGKPTDACAWGVCADADECRGHSDCTSNQYCGDPITGKRKCKSLLAKGQACTKRSQCASGRCQLFRCK
ncbi:hypothetical protein FKG94_07875 [Exilibacterium tricleocarpae]|uniref:Uncharacterized protein n=1 Tax=Exilibacterium tricleocarpae TaxID=2591008 RepID=A0A545TZV9_9GAMM|nr:hypothetical protein FKG94_07875 [Exilibacterium tricleocarpae]